MVERLRKLQATAASGNPDVPPPPLEQRGVGDTAATAAAGSGALTLAATAGRT